MGVCVQPVSATPLVIAPPNTSTSLQGSISTGRRNATRALNSQVGFGNVTPRNSWISLYGIDEGSKLVRTAFEHE